MHAPATPSAVRLTSVAGASSARPNESVGSARQTRWWLTQMLATLASGVHVRTIAIDLAACYILNVRLMLPALVLTTSSWCVPCLQPTSPLAAALATAAAATKPKLAPTTTCPPSATFCCAISPAPPTPGCCHPSRRAYFPAHCQHSASPEAPVLPHAPPWHTHSAHNRPTRGHLNCRRCVHPSLQHPAALCPGDKY